MRKTTLIILCSAIALSLCIFMPKQKSASADASAEALFCLGINMQSDKAMAEQSIIKVVLRIV